MRTEIQDMKLFNLFKKSPITELLLSCMGDNSFGFKYVVMICIIGFLLINNGVVAQYNSENNTNEASKHIDSLIYEMTIDEKIGQMIQSNSPGGKLSTDLAESIRRGQVGSILNEVRPEVILEMQKMAIEESRLGIPILMGRDVIHGFNTIFPTNIGLSATFNPELVQEGARIAAREATNVGLNWNFAPMVDISRDPRWGRIVESGGEDPYLTSVMGLAMLRGFQGDDLRNDQSMAACAKHFAAYGAAEGGRDYNTVSVSDLDLWNIYFPPFHALVKGGVAQHL